MNKRGLGTKGAKLQGSVARGAMGPLGGARQVAGFTLIEIMVVVVIIAILAAVAWPNYERHMLRTNRVNCESVLVSTAAMLERNRATSGFYRGTLPTACPVGATGDAQFYTIETDPPGTITLTSVATSFTLVATPVGEFQNKDRCKKLSLTSSGKKDATGGSVQQCWK